MRASWRTPARLVTLAFLLATAVGTGLLLLPASRPAGVAPDLMAAAFTTVSAVCVTGLTTVDTATMWTPFGQTVILLLIHVGGLGVMTLATLLALAVRRRVGLSDTLVAQAESHTPDLGSVRRVIAKVLLVMVVVETAVALVLTARFRLTYHDDWSTAVWHGGGAGAHRVGGPSSARRLVPPWRRAGGTGGRSRCSERPARRAA